MTRQYFDADLKNQSKRLVTTFHEGLKACDGIIHDSHEDRYFTGKLAWRNPIVFRVSLPKGKRWEFIKLTKIWLARPEVIGIPNMQPPYIRPICFAAMPEPRNKRRAYYFPRTYAEAYIRDFHPVLGDRIINGEAALSRLLSGDLSVLEVRP